ncbi:hypothetical protein AGMMS4956_11040 [Bacteroidia bacterium]|nr:hypothetical protein AGMMS4956_11040 [Bacteroidia bacterium]
MYKKFFYTIIIAMIALVFSNCATILSGRKQSVTFSSTPSGARVVDKKGKEICVTPCAVEIPRKSSTHFTFSKEGYDGCSVLAKGSFNANVLWDIPFISIPFIGIPFVIVDYSTGAAWKYKDNRFVCNLEGGTPYKQDPTIRAGEATNRVTRDKPGSTALERTIIRWNFDSDPRGCRIFWRVISSIPDEVKNTNELYLTTTPYEETRSFNILGLTYENSRDVTIEIKLTKKGFEDQVKRYNVRQAIDQQEIGGFFEMVEKVDYDRPAAKPKKKRVIEEDDDE